MRASRGSWLVCAIVALAAVGVTLGVGSAAAASKTFVGCGSSVSSNVTLVADLNCSGGGDNGLNVDASGITINLNGHTITGAGGNDGYYGIELNGNSFVTIKNGTIANFQRGIDATNLDKLTVTGVHVVLDGFVDGACS